MRLACDTGGTFTDLVVEDAAGRLDMFKASITSVDPVQGVINALALAAEDTGESLAEYLSRTDTFICGTTHAINAVITGSTALLTTEGDGIVSRFSLSPDRGRRHHTRDFDVERLWRDNRLNPIHEGTTGIQAVALSGGSCSTATAPP